jgi:uncharacterized surface protein with fasciclin (FAS1) repeats
MKSRYVGTSFLGLACALAAAAGARAEGGDKDIVDTAVAAGKFKTLVAAVKAAGLAETLKGDGPFTVFAPTDEAFARVGEDKINALLKDKETLKKILTYHVVSGNVTSKDAAALDGKSAKSVEGAPIKVAVDGGSVVLNGKAKVIKADIKCKNGVIHVVDAVLMPPSQ